MSIKSEDVVERLKTLGYTLGDGDTVAIQFAINSAEQYIKNFCNLTEIPQELYYTAVDMAAGVFLKTQYAIGINTADNIDFNSEEIKSIAEGDVSVTYNSDSSCSKAVVYNALLDKLCNRDAELVTFRKLRW